LGFASCYTAVGKGPGEAVDPAGCFDFRIVPVGLLTTNLQVLLARDSENYLNFRVANMVCAIFSKCGATLEMHIVSREGYFLLFDTQRYLTLRS
jgi:hypothetical protein